MENFINTAGGVIVSILALLLGLLLVLTLACLVAEFIASFIEDRKMASLQRKKKQEGTWIKETVPVIITSSGKAYAEERIRYACSECEQWQRIRTRYCSSCGRIMKDGN